MDTHANIVQSQYKAHTSSEVDSGFSFPKSRLLAVNVATVPQRSPLRYPGGKTWLIPHIREWLIKTTPELLIDPFAGGGIVTLTAIMEELVDTAIMIEIDRDVAAFWRTVLDHGETLAKKIIKFNPTYEKVIRLERKQTDCIIEQGFRTLVLNRTRKSGILAPGASFVKKGENGQGIQSRWYPETLASRLMAIKDYSEKITFCEADGMQLLKPLIHGWGKAAAVFIDPPYTAGGKNAGKRLYTHNKINHAELFSMMSQCNVNFLMTYDCAPEIIDLIRKYKFHAVSVQMKNAHHNRLPELVITREPLFT